MRENSCRGRDRIRRGGHLVVAQSLPAVRQVQWSTLVGLVLLLKRLYAIFIPVRPERAGCYPHPETRGSLLNILLPGKKKPSEESVGWLKQSHERKQL